MKKPVAYYFHLIQVFFRNPAKFIRKRKKENILNKGVSKLDQINTERYELRMEMQEKLKKMKAKGKLNDHHATALLTKQYAEQLQKAGVKATVHGHQVIFRKEKYKLEVV